MILQKIHQKASKLYIILPLVALITFLGYESKANPVKLNYSSEEIFKGLFFAEGAVADQIPELEGVHISNYLKDAQQLQHALDFQQSIYEEVERTNPAAIEGLRSAIETGNLVKIEKAMGEAGNAMLEAVNTLTTDEDKSAIADELAAMETSITKEVGTSASKADVDRAVSNYLTGIFSSNANDDIQALLLYLVAVFAIAVYAAAWFWTQGPRSMVSVDTNDMYKEKIVLSVSRLKI